MDKWYNGCIENLNSTLYKTIPENGKIFNQKKLVLAEKVWEMVQNGTGNNFRLRYDMAFKKSGDVSSYRLSGGWVILDIDMLDINDEGELTYVNKLKFELEYAKKIIAYLGLEPKTYKIFFSGKKGFHIFFREEYLSIIHSKTYPDDLQTYMFKLINVLDNLRPIVNGIDFCKLDRSLYSQNKMRNPCIKKSRDRLYYTECVDSDSIDTIIEKASNFTPNTLNDFEYPTFKLQHDQYPSCIMHAFFVDEHSNIKDYSNPYVGCRHDAQLFIRNKLDYMGFSKDDILRILQNFQTFHKLSGRTGEINSLVNDDNKFTIPCNDNSKYCSKECIGHEVIRHSNLDLKEYFLLDNHKYEFFIVVDNKITTEKISNIDTTFNNLKFFNIDMQTYQNMPVGFYVAYNEELRVAIAKLSKQYTGDTLNTHIDEVKIELETIRTEFNKGSLYAFKNVLFIEERIGGKLYIYPIVALDSCNILEFVKLWEKKHNSIIFVDIRGGILRVDYGKFKIKNIAKLLLTSIKRVLLQLGFKNTLDERVGKSYKELTENVVNTALMSYAPKRNIFLEYISIEWDGIDRISNYIRAIQFNENYCNQRDIEIRTQALVNSFVIMLHGQIAEEGLANCTPPILLFIGNQGVGKSRFGLGLCGDAGDSGNYLKDIVCENYKYNPANKLESDLPFSTKMILDLAEFDKLSLKDGDIAAFKSVILTETVSVRRLYENDLTTTPRRAFILASSNKYNCIPGDLGVRRVVVFPVSKIDYDYLNTLDIRQFWAQVYQWYKNIDINNVKISTNPENELFKNNIRFFAFPDDLYKNLERNVVGSVDEGSLYSLETICNLLNPPRCSRLYHALVDEYLQDILKLNYCRFEKEGVIYYRLGKCGFQKSSHIDLQDVMVESVVKTKEPFAPMYDTSVYDDATPKIIKNIL